MERLLESTAPKVQHYNGTTNNLSTDAVLTLYLIGASDLAENIKFGESESNVESRRCVARGYL